MPEILLNRFDDGLGVVNEDSLESGEALFALFEARVRVAEVRCPLKLEDALRLVFGDLDPAELCCLSHGSAFVTLPCYLPQAAADRNTASMTRRVRRMPQA